MTTYVLVERAMGACTYDDGDDTRVLSAWTSKVKARQLVSAWEEEHIGTFKGDGREHKATTSRLGRNAGYDNKGCDSCECEVTLYEVEVDEGVGG